MYEWRFEREGFVEARATGSSEEALSLAFETWLNERAVTDWESAGKLADILDYHSDLELERVEHDTFSWTLSHPDGGTIIVRRLTET